MERRIPTKAQQQALLRVYERFNKPGESYLQFRRRAQWAFGDYLMVQAAGMVIGIESDGYAHT